MVIYYADPLNRSNPIVGFIAEKPGANTCTIAVYGGDGSIGMRWSVRHVDDPGLRDNPRWRERGGWEHAPQTKLLKKFDQMYPDLVKLIARQPVQTKKD
jgi:hypothetical protein